MITKSGSNSFGCKNPSDLRGIAPFCGILMSADTNSFSGNPPTERTALNGAVLQISGEFEDRDACRGSMESARAAKSETSQLARAFEQCGDCLYRFILLRVSNDRHVADDILQQTCFEAARHRRIPNENEACQAWLFGIAKNLIRKHFRQARHDSRQRISFVDASERNGSDQTRDAVGDSIERSEAVPQLLNAIAALNEADQELILCTYFEGRSHEELARVVGVSVRAIEGRLYRARNALRAVLGPNFEGADYEST